VGPMETTPRSVTGVNENAEPSTVDPGRGVPSANVVMELSAGVTGAVGGSGVRRSAAWKQVAPTALSAKNARTSGQPAAAGRGSAHRSRASSIPRISVLLVLIETFLHIELVGRVNSTGSLQGAAAVMGLGAGSCPRGKRAGGNLRSECGGVKGNWKGPHPGPIGKERRGTREGTGSAGETAAETAALLQGAAGCCCVMQCSVPKPQT